MQANTSGIAAYMASALSDEHQDPAKLDFKNPKFVVALPMTNNYPGGFREDYSYNWLSGS